jgi:hypothetical protein
VVITPAQSKNALLDDVLDLVVARADDLTPGGNGSSVSGKTSVSLEPFKLVYDFDEAGREYSRQGCSISATNRQ